MTKKEEVDPEQVQVIDYCMKIINKLPAWTQRFFDKEYVALGYDGEHIKLLFMKGRHIKPTDRAVLISILKEQLDAEPLVIDSSAEGEILH